MRFIIGLIAAVTAIAFSLATAAGQTAIENPQWVDKPGPDDLVWYYPDKAFLSRTSGTAALDCEIETNGRLAKCVATSESPPGLGFGKAAQKASGLFRLEQSQAESAAGRHVRVSLEFSPPDFDTTPKLASGPSVEGLAAVWPTAAKGRPGSAILRCMLTEAGTLKSCKPAVEEPEGLGFGWAAVLISSKITYKPALWRGKAVETPFLVSIKWEGTGELGESLRIVHDFIWAEAPSLADVTAAYPKYALGKGVAGHVVLRCELTAVGHLKGCDTVTETPRGYGFGSAAQKLAPQFKTVDLGGVDPKLIPKVRIEVPVAFDSSLHGPRTLTSVQWTRQPDPGALYSAFPDKAADAHVESGRAVLDCAVALHGTISDCKPTQEEPAGLGFGEAAVAVGQLMSISPWSDEGAPTDGARISFAIRFVHKEPAPATATQAPAAAR